MSDRFPPLKLQDEIDAEDYHAPRAGGDKMFLIFAGAVSAWTALGLASLLF